MTLEFLRCPLSWPFSFFLESLKARREGAALCFELATLTEPRRTACATMAADSAAEALWGLRPISSGRKSPLLTLSASSSSDDDELDEKPLFSVLSGALAPSSCTCSSSSSLLDEKPLFALGTDFCASSFSSLLDPKASLLEASIWDPASSGTTEVNSGMAKSVWFRGDTWCLLVSPVANLSFPILDLGKMLGWNNYGSRTWKPCALIENMHPAFRYMSAWFNQARVTWAKKGTAAVWKNPLPPSSTPNWWTPWISFSVLFHRSKQHINHHKPTPDSMQCLIHLTIQ